jgi:hypothetical protein
MLGGLAQETDLIFGRFVHLMLIEEWEAAQVMAKRRDEEG